MADRPRILVVDDDPPTLRSVERMLRRLGFDVLATTRPLDALDRVVTGDRAFAALLSDVDMPELRGPELVSAIAEAGISIPSVLMSGSFDETTVDQLAKPFSSDQLVAAFAHRGVVARKG